MTDKARELLKQIVAWWDDDKEFIGDFVDEIRAYLAEPEVKRDAAFEAMKEKCPYSGDFRGAFYDGWLCAEKHHGIGGGE